MKTKRKMSIIKLEQFFDGFLTDKKKAWKIPIFRGYLILCIATKRRMI